MQFKDILSSIIRKTISFLVFFCLLRMDSIIAQSPPNPDAVSKNSKSDKKKKKERALDKKSNSDFTSEDQEDIKKQEKLIIDSLSALSPKSIKVESSESTAAAKGATDKEGGEHSKAPKKPLPPPPPPPLEITDKSITFTLPQLPGIAFVKIYDDYWLFFDAKYTLTLPKKRPMGVIELEDFTTKDNSIFRFRLASGYSPIINSARKSWTIEFNTTVRMSRTQKIVEFPKSIDDPVKILLPQFKAELIWTHPKSLVRFSIFTSQKQDGSFTPNSDYPQFKIIESYAGLGIQAKMDSIIAEKDAENINLKGVTALSRAEYSNTIDTISILADYRSLNGINNELKHLNQKPDTPEILFQKALLNTKLAVMNTAGVYINAIEEYQSKMIPVERAKIDLIKLVIATLTPKSENAPKDISFMNHSQASPEYLFWYQLYKRIPQDYSFALKTFLPDYSTPLKNRIVEIILSMPDQHDTLKELVSLGGVDDELRSRAKLKAAMMYPVDLQELESLSNNSPSREVQGMAAFEWVQEKMRLKDITPQEGINKLEPYLLGFGDKTFDAKFLLCDLYIQLKKYTGAIKFYKGMLVEFPEKLEDLQAKVKEAYLGFFNDLALKHSNKEELKDFNPDPLEVVAFYNDFQHLTPEGEEGTKIILEVIQALKALNLLKPAIELLNKTLEVIKDPLMRKKVIFELLLLNIDNRDADGFDKAISNLPSDLTESEQAYKQELQVTSYITRNEAKKALELIGDKEDVDSLKQKHKVYWVSKDYGKLMDVLPPLIEKADRNDKPEFIAHLAACNLLIPIPTYGNQEMRDRFGDLMKGSSFEDMFMALTTPNLNYQEGLKNFNDIEGLLKFVEKETKGDAKSFMKK